MSLSERNALWDSHRKKVLLVSLFLQLHLPGLELDWNALFRVDNRRKKTH